MKQRSEKRMNVDNSQLWSFVTKDTKIKTKTKIKDKGNDNDNDKRRLRGARFISYHFMMIYQ